MLYKNLPKAVQVALQRNFEYLFKTENEAKKCWLARNTQLLFTPVPEGAIPEYIDLLPEGYSLSLVITSDEGGGVFYVSQALKD